MKEQKHMKKGTNMNKRVALISLTAILAIVAVIGVYLTNRNNNIAETNPEIARSMTYNQVQEGEENVEGTNNHVQFDAFFLRDLNGDGEAESVRGTCRQIGSESTLYMELNVLTEGYLEDGVITINSENFYLQTNLPADGELAENYVGSNIKEIKLNRINNGTQKMITGIVRSGDYSNASTKTSAIGNNINNYSKVNSITLTGTYVTTDEEGQEQRTPISKTVEFNVDWHGTTQADMPSYIANTQNLTQEQDIEGAVDREAGTFTVEIRPGMQEVNNEIILSKAYMEGEIPELEGYAPTKVEITGTNVTSTYDEETRKFTAQREAVVDEEGNITSQAYEGTYNKEGYYRYNRFTIKITYPIEAFDSVGADTVEYRLPVTGYYEGYNNANEEFRNPYKSNVVQGTFITTIKDPEGDVALFEVTVGKYVRTPAERYIVSKENLVQMYNGEDAEEQIEDRYQVRWRAYTGKDGATSGLVMRETDEGEEQAVDQFIKTDNSQDNMEEVVTNVGIGFSGATQMLGEEGWIKVYDEETNNLIATFTSTDWNNYTSSNPYMYEVPVNHIRIETSSTNVLSTLDVFNIKEINDEYMLKKYTREEFDKLAYIQSSLVGYLGETRVNSDVHQANYEAPYSIASISISNDTLSTQTTENNDIITINASASQSLNQVEWLNGTFLVKLPEEMLEVEINSVSINNPNVTLESYELIEQDGTKFIKIVTRNEQEATFNISIDVNLTPDPRVATMSRDLELYASNENTSDYFYKSEDIYDVNNNLNITEQVNHTTTSISMVSPNSLLTNQTASNYDDKGSTVVSPQIADIRPVYAVIDQEQEEQTVRVGVELHNNYSSTISEIELIGKIPFEGNTYAISGGDLGSEFTTKMTDTGIEVPENLKDYATVYYSTNENPDRDVSKAENNWKTADQVENWDEIKTFLIDLGDYVMPTGEDDVFYYTLTIPNGVEFNKVAYSHHGVYFALDTEDGKYRTQTEPTKLGFRIAEKYNLELEKYQTGKEKKVPGATYTVQEIIIGEDGTETKGDTKTALTNAEGKLTIANLYAERTYEIRETKTPDNYELNSNVIRFIAHVDNEGTLTIEKTGETKEEPQVTKEDGEDYKVTIKVEDEVKASLKTTKKEAGTENKILGVKYRLTGDSLPESGRVIRTDINGEVQISGLTVNEEYTLAEERAEGYYLASPIKFKVVNNDGTYGVEILEGTVASSNVTEEDEIPTVNLNIENEKIPTYNLQITKVGEVTESAVVEDELTAQAYANLANTQVTGLEGATFRLYKGDQAIGTYTTDEQGQITIEGLYQYVDEKDVEQTYTLKEVIAPEGYAKVQDINFRVQAQDGSLVLIDEDGKERNYTVDGNTIKLTIEDAPSFKLIKKDGETNQTLANVKFAIYNVEDGKETPATNSKGEIVGTRETINGREYYTVITDSNGELTIDLPEGLYKAVELEAPEQYDITGKTYYFGIGSSREGPTELQATYGTTLPEENLYTIDEITATSDGGYIVADRGDAYTAIIKYNSNDEIEWSDKIKVISSLVGSMYIKSISETSDGGYILGAYFSGTTAIIGEYNITNTNDSLFSTDGLLIKYNPNGIVQWVEQICGTRSDAINDVTETSDGGFLAVGRFSGNTTIGTETITSQGSDDGIIIKYNNERQVEWFNVITGNSSDRMNKIITLSQDKNIVFADSTSNSIHVGSKVVDNSSEHGTFLIEYDDKGNIQWVKEVGNIRIVGTMIKTLDGGYLISGHFSGSGTVEGQSVQSNGSNDVIIINYDDNNNAQWIQTYGGTGNELFADVCETNDGGYAITSSFDYTLTLGDYELTSLGSEDVAIIKYDKNGNVEYATSFGGESNDYISSMTVTRDGKIVLGGYFMSESITAGDIELRTLGSKTPYLLKYEEVPLPNPTVTYATSFGGASGDYINSVVATSDGGYVVGGYFQESFTIGNQTLTSAGGYDGIIIKYDSNHNVEWAKSIGGSGDDYVYSVAITNDGKYIVGGYFNSDRITVEEYNLVNNSNSYWNGRKENNGLIIKYDENGKVEWATSIEGSEPNDDNEQIRTVVPTRDGGFIAGGNFTSDTVLVGDYVLNNSGDNDGLIIKYDANGNVEWTTSYGTTYSEDIQSVVESEDGGIIAVGSGYNPLKIFILKYDNYGILKWEKEIETGYSGVIGKVITTDDGGIIVGGYFKGTISVGDYNLTSNGNALDILLVKYDANGNVEWAKSLGGSNYDFLRDMHKTSDGGFLVGGRFSTSTKIGDYELTSNGGADALLIKFDSKGNVEWAISEGGTRSDYIYSAAEVKDGGVIATGGFFDNLIAGDFALESNGSSDAMILKISDLRGVPEVQELTVRNQRKTFKITTDVNEIDGVKGGSISGEDESPYETVKYGDSSTNEIVMTPDADYEIAGITVNGEEWQFTANDDGTYTMPALTNITEDKHVVVTYVQKDHKIIIKKIDAQTKEPLAGAVFRFTQTAGEDASNLYEVEVTTNMEGQAIAQLPFGTFEITEIQAPEGYELNEETLTVEFTADGTKEYTVENNKLQRVIVHHYLKDADGTYTQTPVAENEILTGKSGEKYETKPHLDLEDYELEKDEEGNYVIPEEANGTYDNDTTVDQEVIYYYEAKEYPLTVHHYIEGTTNPVPLKDGSLATDETSTGKEGESYSTDALTPEELDERYELVEVPANAEGTFGTEEVIVTYFYKLKQVKVTTKVEGEGGSISGENDSPYETVDYGEDSTKDIIVTPLQGYRVSNITVNGETIEFTPEENGTVILDKFIDMTEDKEVVVTFEKIPATVIVHHYIENTTTKVPSVEGGVVEDEIKTGVVGDMYASQESDKIQPNYEYVSSTSNTSGIMTEDTIEVIYYYRLKDAGIEQTINKTGTEKITQEDEQVAYTITYTGKVTDYIGKATVTITDTLPYKIDEAKSNLDGGLYNDAENTITWTENVEDINTFTNPTTGEISITKQISVTYNDMDYSKTSFDNKVQGKIELDATNQEEGPVEDTVTTNTDFRTEVTVTKVWNHTNNIYTIPTQVKVQLMNGEDVVQETILTEANKAGEDVNTWSYTFTGLQKYDEEGRLINYTVDETDSEALEYYNKQIEGNTITNTYNGPIITATKAEETENGLGYVVEGETITYTITVRNDGGLAKDVIIQDETPEGTTFVQGSIKVNGSGADNYTEEDLNRGITVNVPSNRETTISFEVTVNPLEENTYYKEITNTALVDGKDTNQVTNIVNKANVKGDKTSVPPSGENVENGQEITYTINLRNEGTAPDTVTVTDEIPEGTEFVAGSIKVGGTERTDLTEESLRTGIDVSVEAENTNTVEFKVRVLDAGDNGTIIENTANVENTPTNTTEHTYVEPIISGEKTATTENNLDYVVEGEQITYTITAENNGDADGIATIVDEIPAGTTFIDGSIRINNVETAHTSAELESGIEVEVPARGKTTLSFVVTVDELEEGIYAGEIRNTAKINGTSTDEIIEEIHKANVEASKESDPASGTEVKEGETITYRIVLDNTKGTAPGEAVVIDKVPEGTTYVEGSMKLGESTIDNDEQDLANGIRVTVPAGERTTLEFQVEVGNLNDEDKIINIATVNGENSNEIVHTYVEPEISAEKSATTEKGLDYVVEGEEITYSITVRNDGGLSKNVEIQDTAPIGTSFVDGSIRINDEETEHTSAELEEGIEVEVPAHGETSISFKVTVDELAEGKYDRTIRNTALVDGTTTNEVREEVNKAHVRIGKTSEPTSGSQVKVGEEIRYVIVLENTEGTAPSTLVVKDSIPEGTSFVEGSIKVKDLEREYTLEDLTTNGIELTVPAGQTRTVEFKVTVNDLENGYIIRNKASITNPETQESKDTNEVTHEYVEAVIEAEKEMSTEKGLSYVIPGETITYTIRVRNTGDLSKKITVKDSVPQGTEFVEGSVLLNGITSNVTKEELESGIEVEAKENTEQTISFTVKVLEGTTEIKNTATVDEKDTNETKVPVLSYEKTVEVIRQTEENILEGTVTAGDKIKYTIRVNNLGEESVTNVTIKDVVPTGTTLSSTSTGAVVNDKNEISWTIDKIAVGATLDVSFEVSVNYDVVDNKVITNIATVDGENTNEVETPYDKPEIKEESWVEKTGTEIINSTEDSITYQITYNATIKDFVGEGKVTLVDYLPYKIDIESQYLDGGLYDAKTKTITWEEDLGAIDTYTNGDKIITLEKEITVKYLYGEEAETLEGTIPNRVEGTLQLTQDDPENLGQDKIVLEDKKEEAHETEVQIPTYIIVHHYIEGTNIKVPSKVYGEVVEDERQDGYVGQDYKASASSNVQENYQVVSNSGNVEGTMTRTPIEVTYYYRLQPGNIVTNTITKDGTDKIINKDDKVSYTISYTGRIENYVGNAKVEIIDYLPFAIDESLSNLNGGTYNSVDKTITWTEDLGRVNTFADGTRNISITKNIEVVFTEMNYTGTSYINRAQGKITLEETNQEQQTPVASKETETEFIKDITVEKVWDDNEDIKGRRPDSVTVQLTADGNTIYNDQELEKVILSDENSWTYTFQDLPKYTEQGQEISYSVVEAETNPGDLEYYNEPVIEVFNIDTTVTVRVTNSYKLMDTNLDSKIEKTGTGAVASSKQEVNYNIKYNAKITEYIGASLVTITDYLPYAIDVEKSELDGGTYDSLTNTITWTENIDHINTYTDGDYQVSINKDITVVFTNLDATAKVMVNKVNGRIDLYENETTNTVETTYETKIEIPGNVIVKYVNQQTGAEIAEGYELKGLAGDAYTTEQKEIYGYTFVESTNNTSGNMIEGTIEVIYYYERTNAGGVIVHYVDEEGNKLADDVTINGKVQDPYRTEQKDIPNYDFVRVEGQTEGELIEGTIEVTYIYTKIPAKVIVQHLEKDDTPDDNTDNVVLAEEEIIEGFSGDSYSTARKEIENYQPADPEPENAEGTMTKEDIYVTYYYERKPSGIVTVKYVDVDTNEEISYKVETEDGEEYVSYREQMSGLCGLEYTTQAKDIPYYNFVEEMRPTNATGVYTEEDIEVIYYYRKQTFNLSVEKQIDRITVNGAEHSLKDGLDQIDVVASKVQETDIVVTYKIVVSNSSEIEGTARVIESIPDFFRVTDGTSTEWLENGKSLEAQVTLQPGETKELTVVLRWIRNSNNFGLQINTVVLTNVSNPANYEETNIEDNTSTAEVIFSVKTGGIDTAIILGTALIVMIGALIITIYLKERKTK